MRLIDADALLEKAWDADTRVGYVQVVDVGDIEEAPTIGWTITCQNCLHLSVCKIANQNISLGTKVKDVVHDCVNFTEEKHGRWIPLGQYVKAPLVKNYKCSECGQWEHERLNYCPNCGAKMNLEE